jgi:hypothetical protein
MFYSLYSIFSDVIDKVQTVLKKLGVSSGKKLKLKHADVHPMLFCRSWMNEDQLNCFLALVTSTYRDNRIPFIK